MYENFIYNLSFISVSLMCAKHVFNNYIIRLMQKSMRLAVCTLYIYILNYVTSLENGPSNDSSGENNYDRGLHNLIILINNEKC